MDSNLKNYPETCGLLQNVLKVLQNEEDVTTGVSFASKLTNIHPKSLNLFILSDITEISDVDRSVVYKAHSDYCINFNKFPTTKELYEDLQGKLPCYMDMGRFRTLLIQMDFCWKKIREDLLVVIERPRATYERFRYFTNVMMFDPKMIYFICEYYVNSSRQFKIYSGKEEDAVIRLICAYSSFNGVQHMEIIDNFNEQNFENFVAGTLLPSLMSSTVIVIPDISQHNGKYIETPTLDSLRIEIMEWLDNNDIPYHVELSKYELMCLVKQYTDTKENVYKIDNLLEAHGHTVLRLPKHIEMLTPAALLAEFLSTNMEREEVDLKKSIKDVLSIVDKQHLNQFNTYIFNEYEMMILKDKELDRNWDLYMANSLSKEAYVDTVLPVFNME